MVFQLTIRNNSQVIGDVGELKTITIFNEWRWAAEKIVQDYGEDINATIFIDNKKTKLYFRCQVKSTQNVNKKSYVRKLKSGDFSVSISTETLKTWFSSYFPVFIVIYDETSGDLFWENPRNQLLNNLQSVNKNKMSIRISKKNILKNGKELIIKSVEDYYKTFTRITTSKLKCSMLPVIMPEYKFASAFDIKNPNYSVVMNGLEVKSSSIIADKLPAWTTMFKSREVSHYFSSIEITCQQTSLNVFINLIKDFIEKIELQTAQKDEWISFIITPILLESKDDNNEFSKKEMTDWLSYSKIGEEIIDDFTYTFRVSGFKNEIIRRSTSWGDKYYIDDVNDVSLELFSLIETTPAIRRTRDALINHAKDQLVSWICPVEKIEILNAKLFELNLCFRSISELDGESNYIQGAITHPMLDLEIGIIPTALSWYDHDSGSVMNKIQEENIIEKLDGHLGDKEAQSELEKIITNYFNNDYKYTILTEYDYFDGLPLMHNQREITLSRFRKMKILNKKNIDRIKEFKYLLESRLSSKVKFEFKTIMELSEETIYSISVSWSPNFNESTSESLEKYKDEIISYFDMIFSREGDKREYMNSKEVLTYYGEITFE